MVLDLYRQRDGSVDGTQLSEVLTVHLPVSTVNGIQRRIHNRAGPRDLLELIEKSL